MASWMRGCTLGLSCDGGFVTCACRLMTFFFLIEAVGVDLDMGFSFHALAYNYDTWSTFGREAKGREE